MRQFFIILKKEFLTRIKKRSFIISTILTPLIIPIFLFGISYLSQKELNENKVKEILVNDQSSQFEFSENGSYKFHKTLGELEKGKELFSEMDYYAYLYIPQQALNSNNEAKENILLFAKSNLSINDVSNIKSYLENQIKEKNIKENSIDSSVLKLLTPSIKIKEIKIDESGKEKQINSAVTFGIGYVLSMLIYIFILISGTQVMHSVIEEKTNKIVEIIISIVKPFQLMMGKVVGIAGVGLFQFLIWGVLAFIFSSVAMSLIPGLLQGTGGSFSTEMQGVPADAMPDSAEMGEIFDILFQIPYLKISALFIFYFVFGFLFYGALFAAVGSAIENPQEAQQFVMPITFPLIAALIGTVSIVILSPNGSASFWLSIIPLTSPISMMGRIAFDVPTWELLLSMSLLLLSCIFTLWAAGRIFKVGLMSQGSKVNYKTLLKWFLGRY